MLDAMETFRIVFIAAAMITKSMFSYLLGKLVKSSKNERFIQLLKDLPPFLQSQKINFSQGMIIYDLYISGMLFTIAAQYFGPQSANLSNMVKSFYANVTEAKNRGKEMLPGIRVYSPIRNDSVNLITSYQNIMRSFLVIASCSMNDNITKLLNFIANNSKDFSGQMNYSFVDKQFAHLQQANQQSLINERVQLMKSHYPPINVDNITVDKDRNLIAIKQPDNQFLIAFSHQDLKS